MPPGDAWRKSNLAFIAALHQRILDVGPLQLVTQDVEASALAKLPGDLLGLRDRHHGEARRGRDALDAEPLSVATSGVPARPTMLMGAGIAWVSLPIVSASVTAKGKTQSAPAAK